jgi:KaiC/GvpD/RAD55 family RecA-like ATPase
VINLPEDGEKEPNVQENARTIAEAIRQFLSNAKDSEFSDAMKPFTTSIKPEEKANNNITKPKDAEKIITNIALFSTKTFIDSFFLTNELKPMEGTPKVAQIGFVGLPDSGKSIILQEIALRLAEHHKVCFVTSEDAFETGTDRFDLQARMKLKADKMGLDWNAIKQNLYVLDTVVKSQLRLWDSLITTYRNLVETEKVEFLLFDSLTLIEDYRSAIKYRLLELVRYNQLHNVTGFYISQRATEDADKFGMAGGIGLSHIFDVVFAIDYQKVWSGDAQMKLDMGVKQGETVRFIRCLKCRLCGFDTRYRRLEITQDGFLKELPAKQPEVK